ncbi:MAG: MerR family transcriptional regulator [Trueperaceae bacterium]
MRIGQLAKATGASVRAIRHYEAMGLLTSQRSENQYREFSQADVERVKIIRLFLSIGICLEEIKEYAPCFQPEIITGSKAHDKLRTLLDEKVKMIETQIDSLTSLRSKLLKFLKGLP